MYYGMLASAALLFAMQFLFNQQYQKNRGDGLDSAVTLSLYMHGISFLIMLLLNKFHLEITWFSLLMAALYAAVVFILPPPSLWNLAITQLLNVPI